MTELSHEATKYDIINLNETKVHNPPTLYGFDHYCSTLQTASGGGVIVYFRFGIPLRLEATEENLVIVRIGDVAIPCPYINNGYSKEGATRFRALLDQLRAVKSPAIMIGDLNCKATLLGNATSNAVGRVADRLSADEGFWFYNEPGVYTYRRHNYTSTIDVTISNRQAFRKSVIAEHSIGGNLGSDHRAQIIKIYSPGTDNRREHKQTSCIDWCSYIQFTSEAKWPQPPEEIYAEALDRYATAFSRVILDCLERARRTRKSKKYIPCWNGKLKHLARRKKLAYDIGDTRLHRRLSREFRREVKQLRKDNWIQAVQSISNSRNARQVWRQMDVLTRHKGKRQVDSTPHFEEACQDKANSIAEVFARITLGTAVQETDCMNPYSILPTVPGATKLQEWELEAAMSKARTRSAPGIDGIPTKALKVLPAAGKQALLTLFNTIWVHGYHPQAWKQAAVIPVSKGDGSYRPISLLPTISKLLEM